jgi:hypothetical protein
MFRTYVHYLSIDAYTSALVYVLLELVVSDNASWLDLCPVDDGVCKSQLSSKVDIE